MQFDYHDLIEHRTLRMNPIPVDCIANRLDRIVSTKVLTELLNQH